MSLKSFLIFSAFVAMALAKPAGDQIVFRDDDDVDETPLTLEDENQVYIPAKTRLDGEENEVVAQRLEHGKFFQGDIKLVQDQKEYLLANASDGSLPTRTGWIDEFYRWPKDDRGNVIMPYTIATDSGYSKYQKQLIRVAMDDIEQYTCIRFVERTYQEDYVHIFSGEGCSSHMGKIGDAQELSLDREGCFARGIIMHELIHALGYDHMHSHADRNKYVDIKWGNIDQDAISNFDTVDPNKFSNFGTSYDLYSVMHYDKAAFSKNGQETIVPRNRRYRNIIGQRIGLSKGDALRVNNMYKCKK